MKNAGRTWTTSLRIVCLTLASICGIHAPQPVVAAAPYANMQLKQAAATLTHTSDTTWTLDKVGSFDASTVTWDALATEGPTVSGLFIHNGFFRVQNKGTAGATIGNIVVNLQTKVGTTWVTRSSNVADATDDDAATSVATAVGTFTENSASGPLVFTDATTNSTFALVPQVTIVPGETKKLRFSSTFSNSVLNLAVGTQARAEIIVSFGNARANGKSAPNVDINGNGIIDADEAWVQSITGRVVTTVPAATPSNQTVTLIDTVQDITTTGTVTFSNPQISITFPTAIVTVNYNGGASGGTITNCAHLVSNGQTTTVLGDPFNNITPINLTACDTQVIGPHTCTPGTVGCGWEDGDVITYSQLSWGEPSLPGGAEIVAHYDTVYATSFGQIEIGIPGTGGFSMIFTSSGAVLAYQPSTGPAAPLNADLLDPMSSASGIFGGEVLGLKFNIDFADAGFTIGGSGVLFGDLTLCGLTGGAAALNNTSVRSFAAMANTALGGGSTPVALADINQVAFDLNNSFSNSAVSLFAQQHLFNGACPP